MECNALNKTIADNPAGVQKRLNQPAGVFFRSETGVVIRLKQIIQYNLSADEAVVLAVPQAVSGNHCHLKGLFCPGFIPEQIHLIPEHEVVGTINFK